MEEHVRCAATLEAFCTSLGYVWSACPAGRVAKMGAFCSLMGYVIGAHRSMCARFAIVAVIYFKAARVRGASSVHVVDQQTSMYCMVITSVGTALSAPSDVFFAKN